MRILFFVLFLSGIGWVKAQESCDGWPEAYSPTVLVWDWRDITTPNHWKAYITSSLGSVEPYIERNLPSPFTDLQTSFDNTLHLFVDSEYQDRDFDPEDGWELVIKSFGSPERPVSTPTLVLYNRFTATLRIFVFPVNREGNGATVTVRFPENATKESGILGLAAGSTKALERFEKKLISRTPNVYFQTNLGQWLMADIPMAYDPCTCQYDGSPTPTNNLTYLRIGAEVMTQSTVTGVYKTLPAPAESLVVQSATASPFSFQSSTAQKSTDNLQLVSGALKTYKSVDGVVKQIEKFLKDNSPNLKNHPPMLDLPDDNVVGLLKVLKDVPFGAGAAAFQVFDMILTGGRKKPKSNVTIPVKEKDYSYQGKIETVSGVEPIVIYTPGTQEQPQDNTNLKTVYNQVLGIANILKEPVLEYVDYQANGIRCVRPLNTVWPLRNEDKRFYGSNEFDIPIVHPTIRQYRLKEPLQIAINPASQLELVDAQYSFQITPGNTKSQEAVTIQQQHWTTNDFYSPNRCYPVVGPVAVRPISIVDTDFFLEYPDRLLSTGLYVQQWPKAQQTDPYGVNDIRSITYATALAPVGCWENQSFMLANYFGNEDNAAGYTPDIKLKLRLHLKRTDSFVTPETERVIFLVTYDVKVVSSEKNIGQNTYNYVYHRPNICEPNELAFLIPPDQFSCHLTGGDPYPLRGINGFQYLDKFHIGDFNSSTNPSGPAFPLGNSGIPENVILKNQTIDTDREIHATNQVTLENVTILPGVQVRIYAGNSIVVDPESEINEDTELIIGIKTFQECNQVQTIATGSQITSFCKNINLYNPYTNAIERSAQVFSDTSTSSLANSEVFISLYPNPTTGMFTLQVGGGDGAAGARAVVWNALGQRVVPGVAVPESGRLELDLRTEAAGVYLVQVVGSTGAVLGSTRLAVQQ